MKNYTHLISEILNTPHMVTLDYYQTVVGAVAERMQVPHIDINGEQIDAEKLKLSAANYVAETFNAESPGDRGMFYSIANGIALIPINGTLVSKNGYLRTSSGMCGYDGIKRRIDYAFSDPEVKAVAYIYGTPGGHVLGNFELADYMYSLRGKKPTLALIDEQACSAGYSLASTADQIYITEHAAAGSIGVLLPHVSRQEQLKKDGVKVTVIHAGNHKIDGNPFEDLADDVKAKLQAQVDNIYQRFTSSVARNLNCDEQMIKDTQAQVYMGQDAVDAGLAHKLVTSFNALDHFQEYIESLNPTATGHQQKDIVMSTENKAPVASSSSGQMTAAEMKTRCNTIITAGNELSLTAVATVIALETETSAEDAQTILQAVADNQPAQPEAAAQDGAKAFQAALKAADAGAVTEEAEDEVTGDPAQATQLERVLSAANKAGVGSKAR